METVKIEDLHELWRGYLLELTRTVAESDGGSEIQKARREMRMVMYIKFLQDIEKLAGNPEDWKEK